MGRRLRRPLHHFKMEKRKELRTEVNVQVKVKVMVLTSKRTGGGEHKQKKRSLVFEQRGTVQSRLDDSASVLRDRQEHNA